MTPQLVLAIGVSIVTTIGVLAAILPLLARRDAVRMARLEGRIDELGGLQERLLRIIFGAETREHHREGGIL